MIIKEKNILSDGNLGGEASDKTNSHKETPYEYSNSKSALLNNPFTSDTQEKICNCLGCNEYADTEISLKISEKSITLPICSKCEYKFKES